MLNLTPHDIVIHVDARDGAGGIVVHTFPASGRLARVSETDRFVGECPETGAPIVRRVYGAVSGLPTDGTPCLVSALVLAALPPGMPGIYAPDTGSTAVRDDRGRIVAVTRLLVS